MVRKKVGYITIVLLMFFLQWNKVGGEELNTSDDLSVVGFQISGNVLYKGENVGVGVKTVYSIDTEIHGKTVERSGLIYGIKKSENVPSQMQIESDSEFVAVKEIAGPKAMEAAREQTELKVSVIMPVYSGLKQEYYVRPYGVLSDGSVVYGTIKGYSAFGIAEELYQKKKSQSSEIHQMLYRDVLKKAEESYEEVPYPESKPYMPVVEDTAYYSDFKTAVEDAMAGTDSRGTSDIFEAEVMLSLEQDVPVITLCKDLSIDETIQIPDDLKINLDRYRICASNGHSISYEKTLSLENGTLDFEQVETVLDGTGAEDSNLCLKKIQIFHDNVEQRGKALTIKAVNLNCDETKIKAQGYLNTRVLYTTGNKVVVKNSTITAEGETDNGFALVMERGNAVVKGNDFSVKAAKWTMGIYCSGTSTARMKKNHILCDGKENNITVYIAANAQVLIESGNHLGMPVSKGGYDSYGTSIFNTGTLQVEGGTFSGGNSGVQCSTGSKTLINGGTFKSPNHGGIYCACGSSGSCEINGGNFLCNRSDFSEETLRGVISFGAGYFGCADRSDSWNVVIRNAYFENRFGNAVVQKSNDGYVPASIELFDCTIKAKDCALWIQNNENVDIYEAYITLYGTCQISGRILDERALETGVSRIGFFY
jgi:hypothetical protein